MKRTDTRLLSSAVALLTFLALIAVPAAARAQRRGGSLRPVQLTDWVPRPAFTLGAFFGEPRELSGLSFPIQLAYPIEQAAVFSIDLPFGYLNAPGENASPEFGNVGVGLRYSRVARLGRRLGMVYGVGLGGRLPTLSVDEDDPYAPSLLRSLLPYSVERWLPSAAAIRLDGGVGLMRGRFAAQLEVGGLAALPTGDESASLHVHYGLLLGGRLGGGLWVFAELTGTDLPDGLQNDLFDGHVVSVSPGVRLQTGGVTPAFTVSIPIVEPDLFDMPVVLGVEIAAF